MIGIGATIGDSAGTNIGISATARRLALDIQTIARIDHGGEDGYSEVVDRVIFPEKLGAHATTNEVLDVSGGGVRTIEQVTEDLEPVEITVTDGAPAAGEPLESVSLLRGSVVVADCAVGEFPSPETVLEPGRPYIVAA